MIMIDEKQSAMKMSNKYRYIYTSIEFKKKSMTSRATFTDNFLVQKSMKNDAKRTP